jgi:DNA-binding XRE family transcriptional regulator
MSFSRVMEPSRSRGRIGPWMRPMLKWSWTSRDKMVGAARNRAIDMNSFDIFRAAACRLVEDRDDLEVSIDEPKSPDGIWFLTVTRDDGFVIEVEWHRHRGFGIAAGRELTFGSGVDEVYGSPESTIGRVIDLVETGDATTGGQPVDLARLRKLRGLLQKDVASQLGISKSGLAQMERAAALTSMQIETLRKLVASMGGELVLTAHFPEGDERRIAID